MFTIFKQNLSQTNDSESKTSQTKLNKNGDLTPTTIGASYFSANYDENGYVFDGVKIDVNTNYYKYFHNKN